MASDDRDMVVLSAIAHHAYCPRRCSLIHLEAEFEENVFTVRGQYTHARADIPISSREGDKRLERALPLWSEELGVAGKADVVEFHDDGNINPVEYKTSKSKGEDGPTSLQLCAQALCLEEMFGTPVRSGSIYYAASHERQDVEFTEGLRQKTKQVVGEVRAMLASGRAAPPVNDKRCPNCSLNGVCIPSCVADLIGVSADEGLFVPSDAEVLE